MDLPAIDAFIRHTHKLLDVERAAEVAETQELRRTLSPQELQQKGVCLLRLQVSEYTSDVGGRPLLELRPTTGGELPAHRVQSGDLVALRTRGGEGSSDDPTGVVRRVRRDSISVVFDKDLDEVPEGALELHKVANDVTYRRLREGLDSLRNSEWRGSRRLRRVLFGDRVPQFGRVVRNDVPGETLDETQQAAVDLALRAEDIALIQGPPGTGKTTTVVAMIAAAVARGERVLACAPSNVAVDNLGERLVAKGVRCVRLGHPARLLPALQEHSLEALADKSDGAQIVRQLRRDLEQLARRRSKTRDRDERRALADERRDLRDQLRDISRRTVDELLEHAEVVLATNTGPLFRLRELEFDRVVIDEAAQALECASWIPLIRARAAVLVGDHRQLPPTIVSREAVKGGLDRTLFERLIEELDSEASTMLGVQYRMHSAIMGWSATTLYDSALTADESVAKHLLRDLEHVAETDDTSLAAVVIDTAGCDMHESENDEGSKSNAGEVRLIRAHVEALLAAGVRPEEIGVITPYNAQVSLLREVLEELAEAIEVDSVDGFQGREKEAILLSLVRSNDRGEVGFVGDVRRLNVAVTRARRHVALVGDSATLCAAPVLAGLFDYLHEAADYRSGWSYPDCM